MEGGCFVHILRHEFGRPKLWNRPRVKIADKGELAGVKLAES